VFYRLLAPALSLFLPLFLLLFLSALSLPAWSEAIAPPPIPLHLTYNKNDTPGFLGHAAAWVHLRKYMPGLEAFEDDGSLIQESQGFHSWTYEVGSYVSLFSIDRISFDVRARLMFQSAVSPNGHWFFLASNFMSDLKARLGLHMDWGHPYIYFRHSCKHDLDQARRLIMHQGFGVGCETPAFNPFGAQGPLRQTRISIEGEGNIPAVFPDQPIELYRWGFAGEIRSDIISVRDWFTIFAQGRGVILGNQRDSNAWVDVDYQLRLGVKFLNRRSYYTLYFEHEKLSDHWSVYNPKPAYLTSFGIMFLGNLAPNS
jgi:hypothetical protein